MFLKSLKIINGKDIIRDIQFKMGINLIVDETKTDDKTKSGNNVGKTTVLKLIDYCLGEEHEKGIYSDPEFPDQDNKEVKEFLLDNEILLQLECVDSLDNPFITINIERNFLKRKKKIQKINGDNFNNLKDFRLYLNELMFNQTEEIPKFRNIIAKNIRYEKLRLENTLNMIHAFTSNLEYQNTIFFWLGLEELIDSRKIELVEKRKTEKAFNKKLKKQNSLSRIKQSLEVIKNDIAQIKSTIEEFGYPQQLEILINKYNIIKEEINKTNSSLNLKYFKKNLINNGLAQLEMEKSNIDTEHVSAIYNAAESYLESIDKTFSQVVRFHNEMIDERIKYLKNDLPDLNREITFLESAKQNLLREGKELRIHMDKYLDSEELIKLNNKLIERYEQKGSLEEKKNLIVESDRLIREYNEKINIIDNALKSKADMIEGRIIKFNKKFSEISNILYNEKLILTSDEKKGIYKFEITGVYQNPGTGKKMGEIVSFDLAYIRFADELGIKCLHFLLYDQMELIHDNQIENIFTKLVYDTNCQFITSILRAKIPQSLQSSNDIVLTLSQDQKLFKI